MGSTMREVTTTGRPVVHLEIGGRDLASAADFYRKLFGWTIGEEEMEGYRVVETESGSIGGGLMRVPEGVEPFVTFYVEVVDLEASLRAAEELGGKRIVDPMPIPGFGAFAMFSDPDGVSIGLFRPEKS